MFVGADECEWYPGITNVQMLYKLFYSRVTKERIARSITESKYRISNESLEWECKATKADSRVGIC